MPFFIPQKTIFKKPVWELHLEIERLIREINDQGYQVGIYQYSMKHGGLDFISFRQISTRPTKKKSRNGVKP